MIRDDLGKSHQALRTPRATASIAVLIGTLTLALLGTVPGWRQAEAAEAADEVPGGPLVRWQYFEAVKLPKQVDSPWVDFVLGPTVFDAARQDLRDLRLYDGAGREVPYALRVREPKHQTEEINADVFNRAEGPDGSRELSLDLGPDPIEHNQVHVQMPGNDFRRRAVLEGSDDNRQWRQLAEQNLIRFRRGDKELEDVTVDYPASRFRYLRLRVYADPQLDDRRLRLGPVTVAKRVDVPGEMFRLEGELGPRQPVRDRQTNAAASAWFVDLGGENFPCRRLEVEITEDEFARNYKIQKVLPPEEVRMIVGEPFKEIARGVWQRRPGEEKKPMVAEFPEVKASRLRVTVIDSANPPLDVRSVTAVTPARQIVFAAPEEPDTGLRLYFGNPKAEDTQYDFARNLPERLEPAPARAELEPRQENPIYVPEPPPLTERWPWLIYVVLGSVCVVLGGIIANVARTAIAAHDESEARGAEQGGATVEPSNPDEPENTQQEGRGDAGCGDDG
jgi:hypothetical protein